MKKLNTYYFFLPILLTFSSILALEPTPFVISGTKPITKGSIDLRVPFKSVIASHQTTPLTKRKLITIIGVLGYTMLKEGDYKDKDLHLFVAKNDYEDIEELDKDFFNVKDGENIGEFFILASGDKQLQQCNEDESLKKLGSPFLRMLALFLTLGKDMQLKNSNTKEYLKEIKHLKKMNEEKKCGLWVFAVVYFIICLEIFFDVFSSIFKYFFPTNMEEWEYDDEEYDSY